MRWALANKNLDNYMNARRFVCLLGLCVFFLTRLDAQAWELCFEASGYLTNQVCIPPGHSLIAGPLVHVAPDTYPLGFGNENQVSNLFPQMPFGTRLYKFNSQTGEFSENRFGRNGWGNPAETLAPGEGAIIFNPTRQTINVDFSGYNTASGQIHLRRGWSLIGSVYTSLGPFVFSGSTWFECNTKFYVEDGDIICTFNQTQRKFEKHKYHTATGWDSYPSMGWNESFWVFTKHPRTIGF